MRTGDDLWALLANRQQKSSFVAFEKSLNIPATVSTIMSSLCMVTLQPTCTHWNQNGKPQYLEVTDKTAATLQGKAKRRGKCHHKCLFSTAYFDPVSKYGSASSSSEPAECLNLCANRSISSTSRKEFNRRILRLSGKKINLPQEKECRSISAAS